MTTRMVALLRGINVGTAKRVAMADLRALLAELGYSDITTHLNSGNAIFTSTASDTTAIAATVEQALIRRVGVQSTVIVRTAAQLAAIMAADPLLDMVTDPAKHLVGFLAGEAGSPAPDKAQTVAALAIAPDQVRLVGHELYLWCPNGVLALMSKINWDRKLGVAVTMRNWSTVVKLAAMAEG